jgi:hypothetical protein
MSERLSPLFVILRTTLKPVAACHREARAASIFIKCYRKRLAHPKPFWSEKWFMPLSGGKQ